MGDRGPFATPKPRNQRSATKVTKEMVNLFERHLWTFPIYLRCMRDDSQCPVRHLGIHCDTCKEAIATTSKLRELIRPYNWDMSGVGSDGKEPPHYVRTPRQRAAWDRAWQLRKQLGDAVVARISLDQLQKLTDLWTGLKKPTVK
jgi:hypothetical protein